MPKTIDTLVEDIYALFNPSRSPTQPTAGTVLPDGKGGGRTDQSNNSPSDGIDGRQRRERDQYDNLGSRLADVLRERISGERGPPTLRLSNLGWSDRKLWYSIKKPHLGEALTPSTRIKFLYGDILEELLLFLAEEAGHTVEGRQDELDVYGVKGHRDAVIDGRTVDIKSASTYSFKKFQSNGLRTDDPFGYLSQIGAYAHGARGDVLVTERDVASFLVIDKTLGHVTLDTYPVDDTDWGAVVAHKKAMLEQETPPERCHTDEPEGKSGNRKLNIQCSYCPFKKECWKDANDGQGLRTFLYSTGPVFLTHVAREPKVSEIQD